MLCQLYGLAVPSEQLGYLQLHHLLDAEVKEMGNLGTDTPQGRCVYARQPSKKEV